MENETMRLRMRILECSLSLEKSINNLFLIYLSILDKNQTKKFGKKAGISFQNKISLLYDFSIISKDEFNYFELVMVFRNKFLHDEDITSFCHIVDDDNSIKKRLSHFSKTEKFDTEKEYDQAYMNLYITALQIILDKISIRKKETLFVAESLSSIAKASFEIRNTSLLFLDEILEILGDAILNYNIDLSTSDLLMEKIENYKNNEILNDASVSIISNEIFLKKVFR